MNKIPWRGEIYWTNLDPTLGTEINKTRPALVVSNNTGNQNSKRIIVAPITSSVSRVSTFEVKIEINSKECKVLLQQIRCIDKIRLGKKIGALDATLMAQVDEALKVALSLF